MAAAQRQAPAHPGIDRTEWFTLGEARAKLNPAQVPFLDRLAAILAGVSGKSG
jgi:predicted NUDIX family NTP pyrophosphohydrolase